MSSPVLLLGAVWLLIIGYGLVYIGYQYFGKNAKVSFKDAFFGSGTGTASNPFTVTQKDTKSLSQFASGTFGGSGRPLAR